MSKVKLKTDNAALFGTKLNIPVDGEISISKSGIIIVSEEASKFLLSSHDGSFYDPEQENEEDDENTSNKSGKQEKGKNDDEDGGEDDTDDDSDQDKDEEDNDEDEEQDDEEEESEDEDEEEDETTNLESLELDELIQLAKDAGIKEPSYRKFKNDKDGMVKFLSERLSD